MKLGCMKHTDKKKKCAPPLDSRLPCTALLNGALTDVMACARSPRLGPWAERSPGRDRWRARSASSEPRRVAAPASPAPQRHNGVVPNTAAVAKVRTVQTDGQTARSMRLWLVHAASCACIFTAAACVAASKCPLHPPPRCAGARRTAAGAGPRCGVVPAPARCTPAGGVPPGVGAAGHVCSRAE